ncbi:hypothetical protein LPJ64_005881, partial [Coemansia asiatica]
INRKIAPSPHRIAVSGMSTMIYFPNLTFQNKPQQRQQQQQTDDDASWVDQALSANTSFAGTFIACVTRDNIFSDKGTYQRCEYRLTWIACDPLKVTSSALLDCSNVDESAPRKQTGTTATDQQQQQQQQQPEAPEGQEGRTVDRDNYRSPKDMTNYDAQYGYVESWSAKAFRIFPALKKRCTAAIPSNDLKIVKMFALAQNDRATGIIEEKQLFEE